MQGSTACKKSATVISDAWHMALLANNGRHKIEGSINSGCKISQMRTKPDLIVNGDIKREISCLHLRHPCSLLLR